MSIQLYGDMLIRAKVHEAQARCREACCRLALVRNGLHRVRPAQTQRATNFAVHPPVVVAAACKAGMWHRASCAQPTCQDIAGGGSAGTVGCALPRWVRNRSDK
eukprot:scaffold134569_cov37-Tisochrysis_lutea.AAC.2